MGEACKKFSCGRKCQDVICMKHQRTKTDVVKVPKCDEICDVNVPVKISAGSCKDCRKIIEDMDKMDINNINCEDDCKENNIGHLHYLCEKTKLEKTLENIKKSL